MLTNQEIRELVAACSCADLRIEVKSDDGDRLYLQVSKGGWRGRKWLLSSHMVPGEVVQTALAAVLAWYEHEAREMFEFRGCALFNPHLELEELVERARTTRS